jgi:hypothetical protein
MWEYAKDAMETDKPWERWEFSHHCSWEALKGGHPSWVDHIQYRRKPQTVNINGFEVPAPLKETPSLRRYYIELAHTSSFYSGETWEDTGTDRRWLKRGIAHATKEAAIASCKARLGIDPNGDSDG